jgi:hypothetical protein
VSVQVASVSGATYVLQSATNLTASINWQNYSTNAGTGSTLSIAAPPTTSGPRRFLRVLAF